MVLWLGGEKQWNTRAAENVSSPRLIELVDLSCYTCFKTERPIGL